MHTASKNGTRGIMAVIAIAAAVGGLFMAGHTLSPATAAKPAALAGLPAVQDIADGDSRLNDYRLERESCCAGSV